MLSRRRSSWNEDHLVPIFRNGRIEEVYWTYGYSPVLDERGDVGGVLVVCTETTPRVIADRRSRTMRSLAERTALATDPGAMLDAAIAALGDARHDVPFALVYRYEAEARSLRLVRAVGVADPAPVDAIVRGRLGPSPFADREPREQVFTCEPALALPGGVWPEAAPAFFVVPVAPLGRGSASDVIVFGLSPRLPFDDAYRSHLNQIANHLGLAQGQINAFRDQAASSQEREKLLQKLEAASRAKDEFLAMLGHELRNPLSPIATALQLMKLRGDTRTLKEQQVIERQVNHLIRLVDDLLDVSRITRGKVELRKERVDVADVVAKAVEMASDLLEQRNHQLSIEVPSGRLWVDGDPVRLAQVVANLLTNAARYTERGGKVEVRARREGHEIVIRVKDNGMGISPDLLPRIFDLFIQGHRTSDRAQGGLGLGLALVKNLIGLHGGSVMALSAGLGRGSEFVIRLPAVATSVAEVSESAGSDPEHRPARPGGNGTRILVVDDNNDAADSLAELLRDAGHDVAVAYSPVAALELAESFRPEVAVIDIGLPVMDGYELAARLRANTLTASCRLIALTGYGQSGDLARSKAGGFQHHLVKPVDIAKLTELVAGDGQGAAGEAAGALGSEGGPLP